MKFIENFIINIKKGFRISAGKIAPTFDEEIDRQCNRIIVPAAIIILFAWLSYIPTDIALHPEVPSLIFFRIGLSVVGLTLLILRFLPKVNIKGSLLMAISGGYLMFATAIITGLVKGDPLYIGGYLFIIMTIIIGPLKKRVSWTLIIGSLTTFFTIGFLRGMSFSTIEASYSIKDLIFTSIVAILFVYVLDRVRYKAYLQSKELEEERNKLKLKSNIIERELKMARTIQESMIPAYDPNDKIASLYKPMEQVGGDFYDFVSFRDTNKIGIFVSDVSGHGVPAAFITSMIKSHIYQAGELRENPAALLKYLNDFLTTQTGSNFVTAFYGIIDFKSHKFIYCNAGHNAPYLVDSKSVNLLKGEGKSLPLSILSNIELEKVNKSYTNTHAKLKKGKKLILYTDGLVETVNIGHQNHHIQAEDFEYAILEDTFKKLYKLPSAKFVQHLFAKLVQFRGSDKFEDDVCIICIDL